jgi:glycosyltransferase involved in cell wall biosynthesis
MASGKYIARMDSDDISLPERLEKQYCFMEAHAEVVVCGAYARMFGDKDKELKRIIPNSGVYKCSVLFGNVYGLVHPTAFFRTDTLKRNNIKYDEELPTAQDYGMWAQCCYFGEIANVDEVLLMYRVHNKQISNAKRTLQENCRNYVIRKQLERLFDVNDQLFDKHISCIDSMRIDKEVGRWFHVMIKKNNYVHAFPKKEFTEFINKLVNERVVDEIINVPDIWHVLGLFCKIPVEYHAILIRQLILRAKNRLSKKHR